MAGDLVYQALAETHTERTAADDFARSYFDKPREVANFIPGDTSHPATFMLLNGLAVYEIQRDPGTRLVSSPTLKIYRKAA